MSLLAGREDGQLIGKGSGSSPHLATSFAAKDALTLLYPIVSKDPLPVHLLESIQCTEKISLSHPRLLTLHAALGVVDPERMYKEGPTTPRSSTSDSDPTTSDSEGEDQSKGDEVQSEEEEGKESGAKRPTLARTVRFYSEAKALSAEALLEAALLKAGVAGSVVTVANKIGGQSPPVLKSVKSEPASLRLHSDDDILYALLANLGYSQVYLFFPPTPLSLVLISSYLVNH